MKLSLNTLKTDNPMTNIYIGSLLFILSIFDVFIYSFLNLNITSFLPGNLNIFFPLIIGLIGLSFIRMEYTGIKFIDNLNKHINTTNFNALYNPTMQQRNIPKTCPHQYVFLISKINIFNIILRCGIVVCSYNGGQT